MIIGYGSPRWSGEILDCSMPMTFDQYSRCSGNCLYCFSYFQKILISVNPLFGKSEDYQKTEIKAVNVGLVKKMFTQGGTQFDEYIHRRITMQWGGLADPFDHFERQHGVGLELLKFFKSINYPICFSTKFTWWLKDKRYTDLFRGQKNWNCKFSIITLNEAKSAAIEKGIPSPSERLDGIHRYAMLDAGGATLRLRPFIIGMSNDDVRPRKRVVPGHVELVHQAGRLGATAVSTEFFCLEGRADPRLKARYDEMSKVLGYDILEFYRKNSPKMSGYLRLNWKIKERYVNEMEHAAEHMNMRFYVSDAHHKDRCANGSCCGLGEHWNYQRGQFTEMLHLAQSRESGEVSWDDMEQHIAGLFDFSWRKAIGFNTGGTKQRCSRWNQSMYDYIHEIWNSPNSAKSPYKYFAGLLRPVRVDESGNVVYKYQSYQEEQR